MAKFAAFIHPSLCHLVSKKKGGSGKAVVVITLLMLGKEVESV